MTGERERWRELPSVQPGGRAPAPGGLALVQSFINTHYDLTGDHGADVFGTARQLGEWLLARGLIAASDRVEDRDLERAKAVREGLRSLARGTDGHVHAEGRRPGLNAAARGAGVEIRFATTGPRFVIWDRGGVAGALGLVLAIATQAMIEGGWSRLKVCPGEDCEWAFYDHSRNHTGRWCSMSVCGARAKARAHYRRQSGAG